MAKEVHSNAMAVRGDEERSKAGLEASTKLKKVSAEIEALAKGQSDERFERARRDVVHMNREILRDHVGFFA